MGFFRRKRDGDEAIVTPYTIAGSDITGGYITTSGSTTTAWGVSSDGGYTFKNAPVQLWGGMVSIGPTIPVQDSEVLFCPICNKEVVLGSGDQVTVYWKDSVKYYCNDCFNIIASKFMKELRKDEARLDDREEL